MVFSFLVFRHLRGRIEKFPEFCRIDITALPVKARVVEFVHMVNSVFQIEVTKCLMDAIRRKRPKKLRSNYILHNDSAPCHTVLIVQHFLAKKQISAITFSRSRSVRRLPLLETQDGAQRSSFWVRGENSTTVREIRSENHTRQWLPEMAGPLHLTCICKRTLLW